MDTQTQQPPAANASDAKNTSTPKGIKALVAWWKSIDLLKYAPWLVFFGTLTIWLVGALTTHGSFLYSWISFGELEQLENTFSPVNAFFAGLSGIGLIATLVLQNRQIKEAKKDAEENNKLLQKQLKDTQDRFKVERFESVFFNMLSIHKDNSKYIESINDINPILKEYQGYKEVNFSDFINLLHQSDSPYKAHINNSEQALGFSCEILGIRNLIEPRITNRYYIDYYLNKDDQTVFVFAVLSEHFKNTFRHYYRHLYHLIKYTDKTFDDDPDKRRLYMRIIRAQFTAAEHVALFYNALYFADPEDRNEAQAAGQPAPEGKQERAAPPTSKFKSLIERNELLHEMDKSMLIYPELHEHFYKKSAYSDD